MKSTLKKIKFLKSYKIKHALPIQNKIPEKSSKLLRDAGQGIFIAGEAVSGASINEALKSGKLAAKKALDYVENKIS